MCEQAIKYVHTLLIGALIRKSKVAVSVERRSMAGRPSRITELECHLGAVLLKKVGKTGLNRYFIRVAQHECCCEQRWYREQTLRPLR